MLVYCNCLITGGYPPSQNKKSMEKVTYVELENILLTITRILGTTGDQSTNIGMLVV
jgi:hypothetical protein